MLWRLASCESWNKACVRESHTNQEPESAKCLNTLMLYDVCFWKRFEGYTVNQSRILPAWNLIPVSTWQLSALMNSSLLASLASGLSGTPIVAIRCPCSGSNYEDILAVGVAVCSRQQPEIEMCGAYWANDKQKGTKNHFGMNHHTVRYRNCC